MNKIIFILLAGILVAKAQPGFDPATYYKGVTVGPKGVYYGNGNGITNISPVAEMRLTTVPALGMSGSGIIITNYATSINTTNFSLSKPLGYITNLAAGRFEIKLMVSIENGDSGSGLEYYTFQIRTNSAAVDATFKFTCRDIGEPGSGATFATVDLPANTRIDAFASCLIGAPNTGCVFDNVVLSVTQLK